MTTTNNRYKFGIMFRNGIFTNFVELNRVASVVTSQRNQSDRTVISVIGDVRNQPVHSTLRAARENESKIVFYAYEPDDDGGMKTRLTLLDLSEVQIEHNPGPYSTSTIILTERFGTERAGEKDGFKVWKKIEGYGDVTAQYEAFIAKKKAAATIKTMETNIHSKFDKADKGATISGNAVFTTYKTTVNAKISNVKVGNVHISANE